MAKANVSLLDLDDYSDKNLAAPLIQPVSNKPCTTSNAKSEVVVPTKTRPVRTIKVSNLGKESQKNELAFALYATINRELRAVDVIFKRCRNDVDMLDTLDTCVAEIETKAESITSDYAKLLQLSDNKVEAKIEKHFEFFIGEVGKITEKILEIQQSMAIQEEQGEEQEELASKKKLLEEEQRKFEEYLAEREKVQLVEEQTRQLQLAAAESTPLNRNSVKDEKNLEVHVIRTDPIDLWSAPTTPPNTDVKPRENLQYLSGNERANYAFKTSQSSDDSIRQLTNKIAQGIKLTRKADIEPDIFKGNILEFDDWECDFDSYLTSMGIEEGPERLRYLKKYVDGPAKECISGHLLIRTEHSYYKARQKLSSRYGNKLDVARSMKNALDNWKKIATDDHQALQKYADYLESCRNAMSSVSGLTSLDDEHTNEKLARVLPDWAHKKWVAVVHRLQKTEMRYPKFSEFSLFVDDLAEMCSLPLMQYVERNDKRRSNTKSFMTNTASTQEPRKCLYCHQKGHTVAECFKLCEKPFNQRMKFVTSEMLCYICARPGHVATNCFYNDKQICRKCKRPGHATCLHKTKEDWNEENQGTKHERPRKYASQQPSPVQQRGEQEMKRSDIQAAPSNCLTTQISNRITSATEWPESQPPPSAQDDRVQTKLSSKNTRTPTHNKIFNMGMPVYVSTTANPKAKILVYAFLDSASDHSYITKDLAKRLKPRQLGRKSVEVETMVGEVQKEEVNIFGDMLIKGYYGGEVALSSAYEWNEIPNSTGEFANHTNVLQQPHLSHLASKLAPPMDIPVGLLIGANCTMASFPLEAVKGDGNMPYALRTELGWAVFGVAKSSHTKQKVYATGLTFDDNDDSCLLSQEDYKFIEILDSQTTISESGNYMMPLPFKERPILPNNFQQAKRRLEGLEKRFMKDPELKTNYEKFMNELLEQNLAEPVDDSSGANGERWYIPHFAVKHPQKNKLRVVFDCKASYQDTSLNDHLLQGPDHMNSLVGILCRFRRESIAISCDIQQMFYNFLVTSNDRDYLRFIWHDQHGQHQTFRMKVHLFGAKSSPGVATYGLRKIAQDHSSVSNAATMFINRDFYVDDGITSVASEGEAIFLINAARDICSKGNLRLHKFASNSAEVLAALPESERSVQNKELMELLPEQRTLGLQWAMESDTFKFINQIQNRQNTRRGILSTVSQLYDPLGFLAPYTLLGKNILQQVNKANLDWDDPIPDTLAGKWSKWMDQLPALEQISIPRCLKPKNYGEVVRRELHNFCDASENGIGACSYIRQINNKGNVHVSFLIGKSRVIPSKGLFTMPRLELMGAVMATNLSKMLHRELDMKFDAEYFWSDSEIVLGWIANTTKKYHPFVHNRVRAITSTTEEKQWYHVPGPLNPADIASRGKPCDQLSNTSWFSGPGFLKEPTITLLNQEQDFINNLDPQDPEIKKAKVMQTAIRPAGITDKFLKFSTWSKLVRSIRVIRSIHRNEKKTWCVKPCSAKSLHEAETKIISAVQQSHYKEDYSTVKQGQQLSKSKPLAKLNPFIDGAGIMRVGGRLQRSQVLSYEEKHPIILPRDAHVTSLIVRHYHNSIYHLGRTSTLSAIRTAGYWVVGATRLVKSMLSKCVTCNRLRGKPITQIMSMLPTERLNPTPPFTNIGIDCFGPFTVKDRRSEVKRWGLLVTCMYSRAVHIELLPDMTTDSFLNALRTLICIRGAINIIYCDRGTNFVGADNELTREFHAMDQGSSALTTFLKENRITFQFNAPHSSHAGGVWERQIRSVRSVLEGMKSTGKYNRLDTPGLRTAFYEAMATVNSRPLAINSLNDPEAPILTPNHLLTSKSRQIGPPPGEFETTEIYGRKMWRKAQQFAEEFWRLWKVEYMQQITKRQRWEHQTRDVHTGDLVMLIEENVLRNEWPYGLVKETLRSADGRVRRVKVKTNAGTILERPIQKLVLLQKQE